MRSPLSQPCCKLSRVERSVGQTFILFEAHHGLSVKLKPEV